LSEPSPKGRRWRRFLFLFVLLGVACQGCFWTMTRPPIPKVVVPDVGVPVMVGDRSVLGGSSLERRDGYWFMVHTGDAVTIGAEHARLGGFLTQRAEDIMQADFQRRLPAPMRLILPPILMWQFRHLGHAIPIEQQEELYGFGMTYADRTPFPLNAYQRGIYYHGLHDMVQNLVGNPWVDPGIAGACTGFGASGSGTTNGHTIVGRNFDFEVVPIFDEEKVIHLYAREGAIPVLSVSWMGMVGVLTGMNAEGIWISLNAAASEGRNRNGPPVSVWVRQILEQAHSIEDVERMLNEAAPMVTDIYIVADGKTGEVVAFERGQTRVGRRDLRPDGKLAVANHLLSDTFAGDEDDQSMRTYTTTLARHERMQELVDEAPLSVERGVEILRDRSGPDGLTLAPGNRNAIDAFIATHSVVADATDRVLWVATAPHTQGAVQSIDLIAELEAAGVDTAPWRSTLSDGARAWEHPPTEAQETLEELDPAAPPRGLPAGDLVLSGEIEGVTRYLALLEDAHGFIENDAPDFALAAARQAEAMYPRSAEAKRIQARAQADAGHKEAARATYEEYLKRYPAFGPEYFGAIRWLEKNGGVPGVSRPDTP
jgi:isopenicillin-N N-acyltransferase like protein